MTRRRHISWPGLALLVAAFILHGQAPKGAKVKVVDRRQLGRLA